MLAVIPKREEAILGRSNEGHATRERIADVFVDLILSKNPRKITVKEVSRLSGVDRQTFYYHFCDIYELAAYAYKRGVARLFGKERIEDTYAGYDSSYCTEIIRGLEGASPGLKELAIFIHTQNPRGHFYNIVKRNITAEALNVGFLEGIKPEQTDLLMNVLTSSHVTILIGWLQGEYNVSGNEIDIILKKKHEAIFSAFRLD
jgi:AcrR family transcriptional regulator